MTQEELEAVVRLWLERAHHADLEQEMPSVDDVAEALPIPREEVKRLLRQVRSDGIEPTRSAGRPWYGFVTAPIIAAALVMLVRAEASSTPPQIDPTLATIEIEGLPAPVSLPVRNSSPRELKRSMVALARHTVGDYDEVPMNVPKLPLSSSQIDDALQGFNDSVTWRRLTFSLGGTRTQVGIPVSREADRRLVSAVEREQGRIIARAVATTVELYQRRRG